VELTIFIVVSLFFVNSLYHLFYDHTTLQLTALTTMAASPVTEGRSPASTAPAFFNLEVKCDQAQKQESDTTASKVRITGSLCGTSSAPENAQLLKTNVTNTANKFTATVFTDENAGKYSTDYIPLNSGKNPIHIEFSYQGGKNVVQDFSITRN
jgi:hypothetical protein